MFSDLKDINSFCSECSHGFKNGTLYGDIDCQCKCHKNKEITDTERLDFLEKNYLYVEPRNSDKKWHVSRGGFNSIKSVDLTLRKAIDAAMRGKDGE